MTFKEFVGQCNLKLDTCTGRNLIVHKLTDSVYILPKYKPYGFTAGKVLKNNLKVFYLQTLKKLNSTDRDELSK